MPVFSSCSNIPRPPEPWASGDVISIHITMPARLAPPLQWLSGRWNMPIASILADILVTETAGRYLLTQLVAHGLQPVQATHSPDSLDMDLQIPALCANALVRELLLRGMLRRATIEVSSLEIPIWKQQKAERILGNLDAEVDRALPGWINRLVADHSKREKLHKIIRAHRRGLLHFDRPHRWGYPANWKEVAHEIRRLDKFACVSCSETEAELHVHHIVYASNFGTHQKTNLVTLCRACHEKEHERIFDFGENMVLSDEIPEI